MDGESSRFLDFILRRLGERHPAELEGVSTPVMEQYQAEVAVLPEQVSVLALWRAATRTPPGCRMGGQTGAGYNSPVPQTLPVSFEAQATRGAAPDPGLRGPCGRGAGEGVQAG